MSEREQRERQQEQRERPLKEREQAPAPEQTAKMLTAKIAVFGNRPLSVTVPVGSSVAEALLAAGISREKLNLRVNGRVAADDYKLEDMDVLTLLPQIRGGC